MKDELKLTIKYKKYVFLSDISSDHNLLFDFKHRTVLSKILECHIISCNHQNQVYNVNFFCEIFVTRIGVGPEDLSSVSTAMIVTFHFCTDVL